MKKLFALILLSTLFGCVQEEPQIKMGTEMMKSFNAAERQDFIVTYESVLSMKPNSLSKLINVNCNSEKGCIELASIIAQTINSMGEDRFIELTKDLNTEERAKLKSMITVGLKNGYRLNDENANKTAEQQFPKLISYLN